MTTPPLKGVEQIARELLARGCHLCAPLERQVDQWVLCFDDCDMRPIFFSGEGCAEAAVKSWEHYNHAWTCTLFRVAALNTDGERIRREALEEAAKRLEQRGRAYQREACDHNFNNVRAQTCFDAATTLRSMLPLSEEV